MPGQLAEVGSDNTTSQALIRVAARSCPADADSSKQPSLLGNICGRAFSAARTRLPKMAVRLQHSRSCSNSSNASEFSMNLASKGYTAICCLASRVGLLLSYGSRYEAMGREVPWPDGWVLLEHIYGTQ